MQPSANETLISTPLELLQLLKQQGGIERRPSPPDDEIKSAEHPTLITFLDTPIIHHKLCTISTFGPINLWQTFFGVCRTDAHF